MRYTIIILLVALLSGSCDNWLDLEPENERLSMDYWTKKEDVHNTMMSAYVRLRDCQAKMFQWGELRADVLEIKTSSGTEEIEKINKQNITSENSIIEWSQFYKVINSANAVIKYAPVVLTRDPLFTEEEMDQYIAEAKVVRSLAYFYLIKAFREVPLITEPYLTDAQDILQPKVAEEAILDRLILDLKWSLKRVPVSYAASGSSLAWENKGRMTRWAAQTLLADIYLWSEKYKECVDACQLIIDSKRYRLVGNEQEEEDENGTTDQESWFSIFYPGLSEESIFEIYYDHANNQRNSLFGWFQKDGTYLLPQRIIDEFEYDNAVIDLRAKNKTYFKQDSWLGVWKYVGASTDGTTKRSGDKQSPNWIVYRYPEVLLMQAEAYTMLDGGMSEGNKIAAVRALNMVKIRAGVPAIDVDVAAQMSEASLMDEILKERKKEFVGEGKRWFDLVRFAKKDGFSKYKKSVIDILLENVPMNERTIYETKLSNEWSFYFPIHKDEIDISKGVLKQNPAYQ